MKLSINLCGPLLFRKDALPFQLPRQVDGFPVTIREAVATSHMFLDHLEVLFEDYAPFSEVGKFAELPQRLKGQRHPL